MRAGCGIAAPGDDRMRSHSKLWPIVSEALVKVGADIF